MSLLRPVIGFEAAGKAVRIAARESTVTRQMRPTGHRRSSTGPATAGTLASARGEGSRVWDPKQDSLEEQEDDTSDSDAIREDEETVQAFREAFEDEQATDGDSRPSLSKESAVKPDEVTSLAFSKHLQLSDKHELGRRLRYQDAMQALLGATKASRGAVPLALLGRRLPRRVRVGPSGHTASRPSNGSDHVASL